MNQELLNKARKTKSPEELLKLANEIGAEGFSEEKAEEIFNALHRSGELSDDELDQAVGGCKTGDNRRVVSRGMECTVKPPVGWKCKVCKQVEGECTCGRPLLTSIEKEWNITANFNKQDICGTCDFCTYEGGKWICNNDVANGW